MSKSLMLLTFINLINYLDRYILAAVAPRVQEDLGLNHFQVGLLMSAFMFGYMATSPFFGYLGDRKNRPKLMAFGVFFWSLATTASGFALTFILLFLTRVCVGVGEASYASIAPGYIRDQIKDMKKVNTAYGIFYTAIPVGAALGYIWGGLAAEKLSWHWAFFIGGAPGILLSFLVYKFKEIPRGVEAEGEMSWKEVIGTAKKLFAIRDYKMSVIGYTAYTFGLGGFAAWAPHFAVHTFHESLTKMNMMIGVVTLSAGFIGTLLGGKFGHMFIGRKNSNTTAGCNYFNALMSLIATPIAVGVFFLNDPWMFAIGLFFVETILFAASAPVTTAIVESAPPAFAASATAVAIFMIHAFGDLISPSLVGWLADFMPMSIAIQILPAAIFVSAIIWWKQAKFVNT